MNQLGETDAGKRCEAADEIAKRGAAARAAVPKLVENLGHYELSVQSSAARALGAIGPAAASAVPALVELATHAKFAGPMWAAAEALVAVCDDPAVVLPVLMLQLRGCIGTPAALARAVGKFGKLAKDAVPLLETQARRNRDPEMEKAAKEALDAILTACSE
jgi:hypothetical protein